MHWLATADGSSELPSLLTQPGTLHCMVCRGQGKKETEAYAAQDGNAGEPVKPAGNPPATGAV